MFHNVSSGPHLAFEIRFDERLSQVTFSFDNNIDDDNPAMSFGPYGYPLSVHENQRTSLRLTAHEAGYVQGIVDSWSLAWAPGEGLGDFNSNGLLDAHDIDRLSSEVRSGTNDPAYDLNADRLVDDLDRIVWVETLRNTYFGDSNLDGEFNTNDLVQVFQAGVYEDQIEGNAGWATGDWNGDADFNSRDLVLAFQSGGYEAGPRPAAVPEPSASLLLLIGIAMAARRRAQVDKLRQCR
jgi:hypothetical protein